jgi:peptidoglycan/LPS O-acetylase OafA/YrhL
MQKPHSNIQKSQFIIPKKNRLDFIDALRGFAALFVFSYHLALLPNPDLSLPWWSSKIILSGGTGVTLFFVVSAFTLTLSMRLHKNEDNSIIRFYIRRLFRVAPLFYVWIFITLIRDKILFDHTHSGDSIILSMIFGFNLVPGKHEGIVWASWTLGVEIIFYLLFPLIYHYVNDVWKALGAFFAALTLSSIYTYLITNYLTLHSESTLKSFLQFSFIHQLPTFMLGILIYFLYEYFILNKPLPASIAFFLISLSFFGYNAYLDGKLQVLFDRLYWQAIIYGLFLLGLAVLPFRIFVNRISGFLGKISFSLYLNHPTVILLLGPVYKSIYGLDLHVTILFGLCILLTTGILIVLSYGTYRLIEQPGIRLGSKINKALSTEHSILSTQTIFPLFKNVKTEETP